MSVQLIQQYYAKVEQMVRYGGTRNESTLRKPFLDSLERYKKKKPKDPTITEKFNTYKFADYKESVIDLLGRICAVSVKTMDVIHAMPD